ncbi:3-oxoacid CoA-transferase subunit B [Ureibacillus endophyticus]|uniref:3-oxoacid CoA-transferase subunit B n=1 Tax=Ureibacillus endophyticus TaxID=1978490 RepID=A0A494YYT0_9BACL|nr:3-oxoacid CoA-transferase subunit B [Lysinibacillus endophyticus]RKQ15164.1 3-oxoacid CoA-transferase subunit B [Lysinibacillus endophyticus]
MSNLDVRNVIAKRIAQELKDRQVVNLGIGIPTLVISYLEDKEVYLQSENGLLGMGPPPLEDEIDADLVSAGKEPITLKKGATLFDSANSFVMIRGGHIDVAVLGVLQVSIKGEIANWAIPNQPILGVGGAMDLIAGAKKVICAGTLFTKNGEAKLVKELQYPISGLRQIDLFITEYAVFAFENGEVIIKEIIGDLTFEQLKERLNIPLRQEITNIYMN